MKTNLYNAILNNHIVRIALGTACILLIPLVAMQFTSEVAWDAADFIIIGILLFGTALVYELVTSRLRSKGHRIAVGIALAVMLMYVWAELAVGIFTDLGS